MEREPADVLRVVQLRTQRYSQTTMALLAPTFGPLGLSPKKVKDTVEKEIPARCIRHTLKVTVKKDKSFTMQQQSPTSFKIKQHLLPACDKNTYVSEKRNCGHYSQRVVEYNGSTGLHQVVQIARENYLEKRSKASSLTAAVMEVLGTCVSMQCKVNGKDPRVVQKQIADAEIIVEDYLDEELYKPSVIL
jgi:large subunit ribosomal protein L12e